MSKLNEDQLNQRIKRNNILTILFMLLLIAGVSAAFYYYDQLKKQKGINQTQQDLIIEKDEAQKKLKNARDSIRLQKDTLENAIGLLQILVNEEMDTTFTTQQILANLRSLAAKEEAKIKNSNQDRERLIKDLYNNSERKRKDAAWGLIKDHGNDKKLVRDLLKSAEGNINLRNNNPSKISQVTYILENLSVQSLVNYEKEVRAFLQAVDEAGMQGNVSRNRKRNIENKLKPSSNS